MSESLPAAQDGVVSSKLTNSPESADEVARTPKQWMIDVNARYQRLMDLLISLSTAALILPPIFLQKFLGVTEEPLAMFLDGWAITSIAAFGLTILIGVIYHWASAKWVKHAWGEKTLLRGNSLERLLDFLFVAGSVTFLGGIATFLLFAKGS